MTTDSPTLTPIVRVVLESELANFIASLPPEVTARVVLCAKDSEGAYRNVTLAELTSAELARRAEPVYTYGHCKSYNQPGGCQQHNLHCGYPDCDRKAAPPVSAGDGS